ncbi:hypothetical protein JW968_03450 [Candidatus Woesearchaeota archaeon]|nr:hypothetical protein [Candidatus Woesearchaeota archaeon]
MKKTTIGLLALMIVGVVASAGIASAFMGQGIGKQLSDEEREAMHDAMESGDYDAWHQAMTDTLTEERFNELVEMHAQKQAIEEAIENKDYDAWVNAMQEMFDEEHFDMMQRPRSNKSNPDGRPPLGGPMHRCSNQ